MTCVKEEEEKETGRGVAARGEGPVFLKALFGKPNNDGGQQRGLRAVAKCSF